MLSSNDLVQFLSVLLLFGENDDLVKFEIVKQLDELSNLLVVVELYVVLLQSVQSEL